MDYIIKISEDRDEIVKKRNINEDNNFVDIKVNKINNDIYLNFSSRLTLYDFARSLLYESLVGDFGQLEFYHLEQDGRNYVVNGLRLFNEKHRLFINYPPVEDKSISDKLDYG
jgi:hypothetical protein